MRSRGVDGAIFRSVTTAGGLSVGGAVRERWVEGVRGVRARSSRTLAAVQQDDVCGSSAHGNSGGMDDDLGKGAEAMQSKCKRPRHAV
jgi:hypothetical protein